MSVMGEMQQRGRWLRVIFLSCVLGLSLPKFTRSGFFTPQLRVGAVWKGELDIEMAAMYLSSVASAYYSSSWSN
jgi:hypothetical protein